MSNTPAWKRVLNGVNITRLVLTNIIFFGGLGLVLCVLIALWMLANHHQRISPSTTLVVDLRGNVVEQYTTDLVGRTIARLAGGESTEENRLFDIIVGLGVAKTDPNITQVVIKTDGLENIGMAQARELAHAIEDFKQSKKPVIAVGQNFDQKQYLIAAAATKVYLDPEGSVAIEGLSHYRQYYREALQDKIGVNVHLFRVGEFKSAAEPYVLDAASPQSKEADLFWMNDIWQRYLADVSRLRRVPVQTLRNSVDGYEKLVDELQGDLAQLAYRQKWVDGLATWGQVEEALVKNGAYDDVNKTFKQVSIGDYYNLVSSSLNRGSNAVAVVVAQGEIVDGEGRSTEMGGEKTAAVLAAVRQSPSVKAVVLRVDSPGGSVFASEQIRREVQLLRESGRPVVVSMGNTAASGGYWISMNASSIMADPSTVTGSIGIFGMLPDVSQALNKIGVHTDGVSTTALAGANDITRPLNPQSARMIQTVINNGYDKFITRVSAARKMGKNDVDSVARGRVWSGAQAKERGLVDRMGGLHDAIVYARDLAHLSPGKSRVLLVETADDGFGRVLSGVESSKVLSQWGARMGVWGALATTLPPQTQKDIQWLQKSVNSQGRVQVSAHCLCELP